MEIFLNSFDHGKVESQDIAPGSHYLHLGGGGGGGVFHLFANKFIELYQIK